MGTNRFTRRRVIEGAGSLTLLGLAGCSAPAGQPTDDAGGGDDHGDDHAGHGESEHGHEQVSEPKATREVLVNTARNGDNTEYHFDPHVTWVEVGGTVTWTLESGTHTATAYHPGNDQPRLVPEGTDAWASGMLSEEGETYEHTFETEGVYHYYCQPHETFGMLATVIVGDPDLDDQAALRVPDDKPEEVRGKLEELNEMCHSIIEGHHEGETTEHGHEEDGHHEGETTERGHEEDDGHHEEDGHHETETTERGHEEEEHHDEETTEHGHDEEENHDAETTTTS